MKMHIEVNDETNTLIVVIQSSGDNDKQEMNELCDCADSNCTICGS
jgi:hypothetical protein